MPYNRRFHPYHRKERPGSASSSSSDSLSTSSCSDEEGEKQCTRCGRRGHTNADCYARTRANGTSLTVTPTTTTPTHARAGVYALQDNAKRVYVGKSQNIAQRVQSHRTGDGTRFLDASSPLRQLRVLTQGAANDLETWERNETLAQMREHGVDSVRGWIFTSTKLTPSERASAVAQVCEKFDLCRSCGRSGHFAERCYARSSAAWYGAPQ